MKKINLSYQLTFFNVNENLPSSSKKYNPLKLSDLARNKINLNDRELNKQIAKRMLNPYYFKNKNLYNILKINLDSHHINHLNSINYNFIYN